MDHSYPLQDLKTETFFLRKKLLKRDKKCGFFFGCKLIGSFSYICQLSSIRKWATVFGWGIIHDKQSASMIEQEVVVLKSFFCQPAKLIPVNSWSIPWELKGRTHGLWIDLSPLDISRCNTLTDFTESVSKMALFCLWMNNSQISILISYYLSGSTTPPQLWGFLAKCGSFDNQTTTPDQVFILHNINVKLYESIFN